jgi:hypothetical protein
MAEERRRGASAQPCCYAHDCAGKEAEQRRVDVVALDDPASSIARTEASRREAHRAARHARQLGRKRERAIPAIA